MTDKTSQALNTPDYDDDFDADDPNDSDYYDDVYDLEFFFGDYAAFPFWNIRQATSLSLGCDPREKISGSFKKIYYLREELIIRAIKSKAQGLTLGEKLWSDRYRMYISEVTPLSFVNWCEENDVSAFPEELAILVKKYDKNESSTSKADLESKCTDYQLEIKELEARNTTLEAEKAKLKEELSEPNGRRKTSWQKGFIGLLAIKYTRDKVLNNFGENAIAYNLNSKEKLTLKQIEDDLARQGIHIDDGSIKALIDSSIHHLHTKSTKQ